MLANLFHLRCFSFNPGIIMIYFFDFEMDFAMVLAVLVLKVLPRFNLMAGEGLARLLVRGKVVD